MNRRQAVALGLAGILAGCKTAPGPLLLAYHPWPGYAPLELVHSRELLPPEQFQVVATSNAQASIEAVRQGRAHGAALTLDEVLRARTQGLPLQIVAVLDISSGADVVFGRQRLSSLSELKGLRIGHEPEAVGELMLAGLLEAAGLDRTAITEVHLPLDQQEAAWLNGQIDALVTFEPVASRIQRAGAVRIFDSQRLPPDTLIADVLAVHADAVASHDAQLHSLMPTLLRGTRMLNIQNLDAQYRLAPWLNLPPEKVMKSFDGLRLTDWHENRRYLVDSRKPLLLRAAERLNAHMVERGMVPAAAPLEGLVNARFMPVEEPT